MIAPSQDEDMVREPVFGAGLFFAGVDPGKDGGVVVLDSIGRLVRAHRTPLVPGAKKGKSVLYDDYAMASLLRGIHHVAIEESRAVPRFFTDAAGARIKAPQGSQSLHVQGEGFGIWRGIAAALRLKRTIIPPKDWQRAMLLGRPKGRKEIKAECWARAFELFPGLRDEISIPSTARPDGAYQGVCDAALIAECARREIVGQLGRGAAG